MKHFSISALLLFVFVCLLAIPASAQKFEVFPYAGGSFFGGFNAFPDQVDQFEFKNPGLFGVRFGGFIDQKFQLEGNVGWMNQFKLRSDLNPDSKAIQYEILGNYNFGKSKFLPYVSAGVGALTMRITEPTLETGDNTVTYFTRVTPFQNGSPIQSTIRSLTFSNNDTFFTWSYGGGIRLPRMWGPVGLRFDLRGRNTPNFFGESLNSFEPTGGITITWGEP